MKVTVVGLGHVGLVSAACFAHLGHDVLGLDSDLDKLRLIGQGEIPFHEPDLLPMVRTQLAEGRLRVSESVAEAAGHGDIAFICVGTPIKDSGEANLTFVEEAARSLAPHLDGYTVLTEKSTVPVGTGEWIRWTAGWTAPAAEFDVASNPEFLREGQAVADTLRPYRVVVGAPSRRAHDRLREFYGPVIESTGCPYIATDLATAELIKLASNAFLATKVSFINAVADVCEAAGADVEVVARGMGMDPRIGSDFLRAGLGYGGFCLPKDLAAFRHKASELGVDLRLLDEVARINSRRHGAVLSKLRRILWNLQGKRIAVWGLAFKAGTDDLRHAPAVDFIGHLLAEGAEVSACDPVATAPAREALPEVKLFEDPYQAASGVDAVVIATEWDEYRNADLPRLRSVMAQPVLVDARNVLDPGAAVAEGFVYASVGRPTLYPHGHPGHQAGGTAARSRPF
jgi:UDPglucose 6-dehydrogenase